MTTAEIEAAAFAAGRCDDCGATEQSCAARGRCCRLCTHTFGDEPLIDETPPQPVGSVAEQLVRRALETADPRLQRAASRVADAVGKLKAALEEYSAKEDLRRRRDELEAELAKVRAQLSPARRSAKPAAGDHRCPVAGCARSFPAAQGLSMHKRRAHGGAS